MDTKINPKYHAMTTKGACKLILKYYSERLCLI